MQDAGLDEAIREELPRQITLADLVNEVNNAWGVMDVTQDMLAQYLADRQAAGQFLDITTSGGSLPEGVSRAEAPTGFGQDGDGIWFSTPNSGTHMMAWYVNGTLKFTEVVDTANNRYMIKSRLGVEAGDIIQACVVENGVFGWWGRVEVV
jgi:hypothetical protein